MYMAKLLINHPPLKLYLPHPEQANQLLEAIEEDRQYLEEHVPWVKSVLSLQDAERVLLEAKLFAQGGQQLISFIFYHDELIGSVGLVRIDKKHHVAEIGFWLRRSYQGKGFMSTSARSFISFAFETLQLNRLEMRIPQANPKATYIPKALGFTLEGTLKQAVYKKNTYLDVLIFGVIRRKWKP